MLEIIQFPWLKSKLFFDYETDNILLTCLDVNSLMNFGYNGEFLNNTILKILKQQKSSGSWERKAFYMGPAYNPSFYFGSEESTTAICLEAIIKYKDLIY